MTLRIKHCSPRYLSWSQFPHGNPLQTGTISVGIVVTAVLCVLSCSAIPEKTVHWLVWKSRLRANLKPKTFTYRSFSLDCERFWLCFWWFGIVKRPDRDPLVNSLVKRTVNIYSNHLEVAYDICSHLWLVLTIDSHVREPNINIRKIFCIAWGCALWSVITRVLSVYVVGDLALESCM